MHALAGIVSRGANRKYTLLYMFLFHGTYAILMNQSEMATQTIKFNLHMNRELEAEVTTVRLCTYVYTS